MIWAVNGVELAIVIEGRREDWPRGTRTLTPHDPIPPPATSPAITGGRRAVRGDPTTTPKTARLPPWPPAATPPGETLPAVEKSPYCESSRRFDVFPS